MKYFGEASAFKQFTNGKGINFYPIDRGTWYGTSPDNGYVKKLGKNTKSEYVSVKFEELDGYLKSLEDNTPETSYKIRVTDIPESGIGGVTNSGTLGNILKSNKTKYISLKFDHSLDNVTNASGMFARCTGLTTIDTTPFINVTNASNMFDECVGLTTIDTTPFINVTNASSMFGGCTGLTTIDTTPFANVTYADYMFARCTLTAYYSSEEDNLYKKYRDIVSGNITWVKK